MTTLAIAGVAGRMGRRLLALAAQDDELQTVSALEAPGHPKVGQQIEGVTVTDTIADPFDVLIDFTLPDGTIHWLKSALHRNKPIVIGTTGHSEQQLARIRDAAKKIPVLKAMNMSLGVNLLFRLVGQVAKALGDDYDIEIVEAHHRFKVDAPSGTALELLQSILDVTGRDAEKDVVYGRKGQTGQRPARQIGMHSLRGGDTVGEHLVRFGTLGETIELKHTAHTRDTFVNGALRAAKWLPGKKPGLYDMQDVLFGSNR